MPENLYRCCPQCHARSDMTSFNCCPDKHLSGCREHDPDGTMLLIVDRMSLFWEEFNA